MSVADVIDDVIGDLIEDIVVEYEYDIDLDEEYLDLLMYIYNKLAKAWFRDRKPDLYEFEAKLRDVRRRHKNKLKIVLSYLISRFIKERKLARARDRDYSHPLF